MIGDNYGEVIICLDGFCVIVCFEVEVFEGSYGVLGNEFIVVDVISFDEVIVLDVLYIIVIGGYYGLVLVFLVKNYIGVVGSLVKEFVYIIIVRDYNLFVVSYLLKMKNNCIGQELSELIYIMIIVNQFVEVCVFLIVFYGNEKDGNLIGEFLCIILIRDWFGLVIVG